MDFQFPDATRDDRLAPGDPRAALASQLDDLIARAPGPLTLSLEGAWGSGKSDFLKRWMRPAPEGETRYAYFDAFLNDHATDPLIGLTRAVVAAVEDDATRASDLARLKSAAIQAAPVLGRIGLAAASSGLSEVAMLGLGRIGKAATKAAAEEVEDLFSAASSREAAMEAFQKTLRDLTAHAPEKGDTARKLVLIVDELDRCRPDYALQVLEVVKHFFDVPAVFFVICYERDTMEAAIAARYGNVDAGRYLEKFIHLTLGLPRPDWDQTSYAYVKDLLKRYGLLDRFARALDETWSHASLFERLNYRDIQRACATLSALEPVMPHFHPHHDVAAFLWAFAKHRFPEKARRMFRGENSADWFAPELQLNDSLSNDSEALLWACYITRAIFGGTEQRWDREMLEEAEENRKYFARDSRAFFAPLAPILQS